MDKPMIILFIDSMRNSPKMARIRRRRGMRMRMRMERLRRMRIRLVKILLTGFLRLIRKLSSCNPF